MSRGAFLTPVFVFGSTRPGAGKSSLVAHLATWWHSQGRKVAIIDLNGAFPMQLRCAFARSLAIEEYPELSEIAGRISGRFKRNFFFANTERLSLFPSGLVRDPLTLVHDAALRDFFLQVRGTFDIVLINLQPGIQAVAAAEGFLTRRGGREGSPPTGVLITTTEQKHLLAIDSLVRSRPAFPYLFAESLFVILNRIPRVVEQHSVAEELVGPSEVRSILKLPLSTSISAIDEWQRQPFDSSPLVLADPSLLRQTISGLARRLLDLGDLPPHEASESEGDQDGFGPCLEPALLERLQPLMEAFRETLARRLFMPVDEISSFVETSDQALRLRIRLSGRARPSFQVHRSLPFAGPGEIRRPPFPADFPLRLEVASKAERIREKSVPLTLGAEPVYQFDDRFADRASWDLVFGPPWISTGSTIKYESQFKQEIRLPEVPTLGQMLGFGRKRRVTLEPRSLAAAAYSLNETGHLTPHGFPVSLKSPRIEVLTAVSLPLPAVRPFSPCVLVQPGLHRPIFAQGSADTEPDLPDLFKRSWQLTAGALAIDESFHRLPGVIPVLKPTIFPSPRGFSGDLRPGRVDLAGLLARSVRIEGPGVAQRFAQIKLKTFTPSVGLSAARSFPGAPPRLMDEKVFRVMAKGSHAWSRPGHVDLRDGPGWNPQPRLSSRRDLPARSAVPSRPGSVWPLEYPGWPRQLRSIHRFARPKTIPIPQPKLRESRSALAERRRFTMDPILIAHSLDVVFRQPRWGFFEPPWFPDQRNVSNFHLSPAFPRRHESDGRQEPPAKPNPMVPLRLSLTLRDMLWSFRHLPWAPPEPAPHRLRGIFPALGLRERFSFPGSGPRLFPSPVILDTDHPGSRRQHLWKVGKPETISPPRRPDCGTWSPVPRDTAGERESVRIFPPCHHSPDERVFRFTLADRSDAQRFQTIQRQSFCRLGASERYALHSEIPFVTQDLVTRAYFGYVPREAWFHLVSEPLALFLRPLPTLSVLAGADAASQPLPISRDHRGDVEQRRAVLPVFHREHRWPHPPFAEGLPPFHWLFPTLPYLLENPRGEALQTSTFAIVPQPQTIVPGAVFHDFSFVPITRFHPQSVGNPYHQPSLDFAPLAVSRSTLPGHGLKVLEVLYRHLQQTLLTNRFQLPYPRKSEERIGTIFHRETTGFRVGERIVWKDASIKVRAPRMPTQIGQPCRSWLRIIDPKRRDLLSAAQRVSSLIDEAAKPLLDSSRRGQP